MKKRDRQHKLQYQDVFLYTRITSKFMDTGFSADVSSPFEYKDGVRLEVWVDNDSIVGIAQRNFQRDRLYENRGKLIICGQDTTEHPMKIIGKWSTVKKEVTLYPTERLVPEEIKLLGLIQKHLTSNDIKVIIELDEKRRYRLETRRQRGDFIQRRDVPVSRYETSDYDDD